MYQKTAISLKHVPVLKVLLVEDNQALASLTAEGLERAGFCVDAANDAKDATRAVGETRYAAIILDIGLPDEDGLVWLRRFRTEGGATPVILVTARDGVSARATGLRAGADDFLAKPFHLKELTERLHALSRRANGFSGDTLTFGNITFDVGDRQLIVAGKEQSAPSRELAILEMLLRQNGRVVSRRKLEDQLFGLSGEGTQNAVEVYVHRLRRLLADWAANAQIHPIRGVGYLLASTSSEA